MCGILGVFNKSGILEDQFFKQRDSISHRGPDDSGIWFSEGRTIGLASRRLAIQDLSANGHMPMVSEDNKRILVFNGELYNHLKIRDSLLELGYNFKSSSDTECVLYAYVEWGKEFIDRLEGMFALGIYDANSNEFILGRDRTGEKPIYYWKNNNGFSFSSELKQLLIDSSLSRNLNLVALKQYLEDGFTKGSVTFINDVYKLPAASILTYNLTDSNISVKKYWNIPKQNIENCDKIILVDELDNLLAKSVKSQMISDVPLGVLLSGGVDSSLITTYAAEFSSTRLKTFHISFDGFKRYDESQFAKKVADYYNTEHHDLSGSDMNFNLIDEILNYYDEPLGDSSMLPTFLVSRLTKNYVTVALGGDGGDELFGGYTSYRDIIKQDEVLRKIPSSIKNIASHFGNFLPVGLKGKNFLTNLNGNQYQRFVYNRLFDPIAISNVLSSEMYSRLTDISSKPILDDTGDLIYDITRYDFQNYLVEDILVKVDRASMASSLEMRAPWLDKDLIEFAFSSVPSSLKSTHSELKILPKELLKKRLPISLEVDRKQGFSVPLNDWIASKWYNDFVEEINNLPTLFNKKFILNMCYNVKYGFSNSSRLFAIVVLSKWLKKHKINY